ncbi:MAG: hypothetical protein ACI37O_01595 [Candidatus Avelusimicrobium sp.]
MATLRELKEYYNFGDVIDMAEVIICKSYNEVLAIKQAKEK